MTRRIRVLIVDDSALVRRLLCDALEQELDLEVVGAVPDPVAAIEKLDLLRPDVLTLDLEMPRMNGLTFLRRLMATRPMPVIVISSTGQATCRAAMDAMEAGAVEVLAKPAGPHSVGELRLTLGHKIRAAAASKLRCSRPSVRPAQSRHPAGPFRRSVVVIGASTGGTEAIRHVLEAMPSNCPPIVAVQHIPPLFSKSFAERLDQLCSISVREAQSGDKLVPGTALIAPGDYHLTLSGGAFLTVQLRQGPRVCYERPSADVLFRSTAQVCGRRAIGVILTGMGNDGAEGLLALRQAGAHTIAQDRSTSVVYGMPAEAARLGAACEILPLSRIPDAIFAASRQMHV